MGFGWFRPSEPDPSHQKTKTWKGKKTDPKLPQHKGWAVGKRGQDNARRNPKGEGSAR